MKWLIALCTLAISANALALNIAELRENKNETQNVSRDFSKLDTTQIKERGLASQQQHIDYLNTLLQKKNKEQGNDVKQAEGLILFVSFSMPDSLLVSLSEEAKSYNIPLVIRGLVDNDFKKTLLRIKSLHDYASSRQQTFHGIAIDPLWFEQFQIEVVPALVATKRSSSCQLQTLCPNQPFDVIYGNSSIKNSLEVIRDKSVAFQEVAAAALEGARHA